MARPKITTRFFSIEATYRDSRLFSSDTRKVLLKVKAGRKEIGTAVMAAYGFDESSREIALEKDKPNVITMILETQEKVSKASVHVLDANTYVELAVLKDIPVDISI